MVEGRGRRSRRVGAPLKVILALVSLFVGGGCQRDSGPDSETPTRFYLGLGDRLGWYENGQMVRWHERAEADGLEFELVEIWLTKGWDNTWVNGEDLDDPEHAGFFGEAEKYWGLMDSNGEPKLAWQVRKEKSGRTLQGDSDWQGKVLLNHWRLRLGDGSLKENFPERAGV